MVDHEGLTNYGNVTQERRREMSQCAALIGINNKIPRLIGRGSGGFWPNEGMEQPMERQAVFGISNHPGLVRRGVRLASSFGCKATLPLRHPIAVDPFHLAE